MRIYFGADHRGFELKQQLKQWLSEEGYAAEDIGSHVLDPADDYPLISEKLGRAVTASEDSFGILLCGSGVGASAAVNKIDGIRGAIGVSVDQVRAGRHDDDMNVLVLPSDEIQFDDAKKLVEVFLGTSYAKEDRYERRLGEIKRLEENRTD